MPKGTQQRERETMKASAMDWPTTVSEYRRLFGDVEVKRGFTLRGPNLLTPEVLGFVKVPGSVVEITTGTGFGGERIFGVTFERATHAIPDERDGMFYSLDTVHVYLYGDES
jgi:hypothetical protein